MKLNSLKSKFVSGLFFIFLLGQCGCVYLVVGGIGALGGYAVSPDTFEGSVTGRNLQDIWSASVEIVSIMGIIEEKNEVAGILIARVQGTHVTLTLIESGNDTVKIRIKARKGIVPKIRLAQDIYTKILQKATP